MHISHTTHHHYHTQPGQPMVPVKLTDVDEDGIISVQLLGPGLTYLDQLLTEMNNPNSRIRVRAAHACVCRAHMGTSWDMRKGEAISSGALQLCANNGLSAPISIINN